MVPAWVAPFVRSPPSSPDEVTKAPGPLDRESRCLKSCHITPKHAVVRSITVYVPVVGAFVATCTAEAPAELVASSTPVGDTGRIQGLNPADSGATSPMLRAISPFPYATLFRSSRSPR